MTIPAMPDHKKMPTMPGARVPMYRWNADFSAFSANHGWGNGGMAVLMQVHRVDGNPARNERGERLHTTGLTFGELMEEIGDLVRRLIPPDHPPGLVPAQGDPTPWTAVEDEEADAS